MGDAIWVLYKMEHFARDAESAEKSRQSVLHETESGRLLAVVPLDVKNTFNKAKFCKYCIISYCVIFFNVLWRKSDTSDYLIMV